MPEPTKQTDDTMVRWTGPSKSSEDSMPTGGCGVGLNVWVEEGDILIYFQQSGAFDEHNGFPKLGRLRLTPMLNGTASGGPPEGSANTFPPGMAEFCQTLDTSTGEIEVTWNFGSQSVHATVWASQLNPEFHVEVEGSSEIGWEVRYESWRFQDRVSPGQREGASYFGDRFDIFAYTRYPHDLVRHKDTVTRLELERAGRRSHAVCFYHQNDNNDLAFDKEMDQQGFGEYKEGLYNPQRDLVFGGVLLAEGAEYKAAEYKGTEEGSYLGTPYVAHLLSLTPAERSRVTVLCRTGKHSGADDWLAPILARAAKLDDTMISRDREATHAWWKDFWQRSHVRIEPRDNDGERSRRAREVAKNYRLFRFMLGTNNKGTFPTKFNGGLHTYDSGLVRDVEMDRGLGVDEPQNTRYMDFGPDFRAWGGGSLTQQNQRLVYWPMIKSGDTDLMGPQLDWCVNALPAAELRSQIAWGHAGCSFTEQINNFGIPIGSHFGWNRDPTLGLGEQISQPVNKLYHAQLEFAWMMLMIHRYTGAIKPEYLRFINSATEFYFLHYEYEASVRGRDAYDKDGKLIISPSIALETYRDATNPTEVITGLRSIYEYLLENELADDDTKRHYQERLLHLPEPSAREMDGKTCISPAASWNDVKNCELPQLYPVFPYERLGIGKPHLELARNTWRHGSHDVDCQKGYISWQQTGIFCAHLGLLDEAVRYLFLKLADGGRRFPAYWGPGADWVPDHNWGGCGMIQLQDMLLQTAADSILLLPCWPKEWDVSFKLHAPGNTVVECEYRGASIERLVVTPRSREADVVLPDYLG